MKFPQVFTKILKGCLALLCVVEADASTWNQSANGTYDWSDPGNWVDGDAPALVESDTVQFPLGGSDNGVYGVILDVATQTFETGLTFSINVTKPSALTFDLNENRMIFDGGALTFATNSAPDPARTPLTFINGHMQMGTASHAASLVMGISGGNQTSAGYTMVMGNGVVFDSVHLAEIAVSANQANYRQFFTLDLSKATLRSGVVADTLKVNGSIRIGEGLSPTISNGRDREGRLLLGKAARIEIGEDLSVGYSAKTNAAVNLTQGLVRFHEEGPSSAVLEVGRSLRLGVGVDAIGKVENLPSSLDLRVGKETTPPAERGAISVGYFDNASQAGNAEGEWISAGGSFSAYVDELRVGDNLSSNANSAAEGVLDFSTATLGTLMIEGAANIGTGHQAVGRLALREGEAFSATLRVGVSSGDAVETSLLRLDGTHWSVSESLQIGANGRVEILPGLTGTGLEIGGETADGFTIDQGGVVAFTFDIAALENDVWGLKMAGDQRSLFAGFLDEENPAFLTDGLYGEQATVFYDGVATYYGLRAIPEPSVLLYSGLALLVWGCTALRRKS